ncbi:MAG: hypothetical protein ABIZ34_01555 [Candidatus Limnocylindrales bacterium]
MSRNRSTVVLFMVVLCLPAPLMLVSAPPPRIQNRPLVELPEADVTALGDPAFYGSMDDYLSDHFPLRAGAIAVVADVEYRVFRMSLNPAVIVGRGDWLWYRDDLQPQCVRDPAKLLANIDSLAAAFAASGRPFRHVIAPDKHVMYPQFLASPWDERTTCVDVNREAFRAGAALRPDTTMDLWPLMFEERDRSGDVPIYWPQDTHWAPRAALLAARQIVLAEPDSPWDDTVVHEAGTVDRFGDLLGQMGLVDYQTLPAYVVERPGVTVTRTALEPVGGLEGGHVVPVVWETTGDAPVIPGTTLFLYDSYGAGAAAYLAPWYERMVWVHAGDTDLPNFLDVIPHFDRVVYEGVERYAYLTDPVHQLEPIFDRLAAGGFPARP